CRVLHEAAMAADSALGSGGDYGDSALHKVVAFLLFVFENNTQGFPTFNTVGVGAVGGGSQSRMGSSKSLDFVLEFFKRLDPSKSALSISNSVEQRLAVLRKRRKAGIEDYHEVVKLLD